MKRCAYAYVPSFVRIDAYRGDLDHYARVLPCQSKMLRKWFYRTAKRVALSEGMDPALADFYQSRVSALSVRERHYGLMREEADRLYPKVMGELGKLL